MLFVLLKMYIFFVQLLNQLLGSYRPEAQKCKQEMKTIWRLKLFVIPIDDYVGLHMVNWQSCFPTQAFKCIKHSGKLELYLPLLVKRDLNFIAKGNYHSLLTS